MNSKTCGFRDHRGPRDFQLGFQPGPSDADEFGFVQMPNIKLLKRWGTCCRPSARTSQRDGRHHDTEHGPQALKSSSSGVD